MIVSRPTKSATQLFLKRINTPRYDNILGKSVVSKNRLYYSTSEISEPVPKRPLHTRTSISKPKARDSIQKKAQEVVDNSIPTPRPDDLQSVDTDIDRESLTTLHSHLDTRRILQ